MKALAGNFNQEKAKGAFTVVVKTVGSFAALVRTAAGSNISITDTSPCRDPEVTTIIGHFFQFQTISYHDTMTLYRMHFAEFRGHAFSKTNKALNFFIPSPSLGIGYARNGDKCISIE